MCTKPVERNEFSFWLNYLYYKNVVVPFGEILRLICHPHPQRGKKGMKHSASEPEKRRATSRKSAKRAPQLTYLLIMLKVPQTRGQLCGKKEA
jgi:hypothetical protein